MPLFDRQGCGVATAAWSAVARSGGQVETCHQCGANRFGLGSGAAGIRGSALPVTTGRFLQAMAIRGGVVGLRPFQKGG